MIVYVLVLLKCSMVWYNMIYHNMLDTYDNTDDTGNDNNMCIWIYIYIYIYVLTIMSIINIYYTIT